MITGQIELYEKIAGYEFEKIKNDDFYDKLSRKFSFSLMIIFGGILGVSQLVGKPISCWCQSEYSGPKCDYATKYCYITSFYVPVGNQTTLPKREDLESHRILYYQWVPYIFLFQAFLYYAPSILWSYLSKKTDYDIDTNVEALNDKDNKELAISFVSSNFERITDVSSRLESRGLFKRLFKICLPSGIYLSFCHFFIKLLYAFVALLQIFILNYWFRDDHYSNKQDKMSYFYGSHNWKLSERFPRMTLCRFEVYVLNEKQAHWVQCALPNNIYIEKMYIIIAIWSLILFGLTLYKAIRSLISICTTRSETFINHYLNKLSDDERKDLNGKSDHLEFKLDDMIALRLIHENTDALVVAQIIKKLCLKNFEKRQLNQ